MKTISTWGRGSVGDIRVRDASLENILRRLERETGLKVCSRPCSQGIALERGKPSAAHYSVTLGRPVKGGGYSPEAEIWFSVPIESEGES